MRCQTPQSDAAYELMVARLAQADTQNSLLQQELEVTRKVLAKTRQDLLGTQAGERRARHSAMHDSLTRLPNRQFFDDALHVALAPRAHSIREMWTLLFLDLDNFKAINDTCGHGVGDELLRVVAARLRPAITVHCTVYRLGGDEFACLLRGVLTRQTLADIALGLLNTIAAPCRIGTLDLEIRPSIGIALFPADGQTPQCLLQSADTAMYQAKRLHKGYAFFDQCIFSEVVDGSTTVRNAL